MDNKAQDATLPNYSAWYQPAQDEPSPFTGKHGRVSRYWLAWYIRNNPRTALQQAIAKGEELIQQLVNEPRREDILGQPEPKVFVDVLLSDSVARCIPRLEWVIWYRYTKNVGYGSAHQEGMWHPSLDTE